MVRDATNVHTPLRHQCTHMSASTSTGRDTAMRGALEPLGKVIEVLIIGSLDLYTGEADIGGRRDPVGQREFGEHHQAGGKLRHQSVSLN